MDDDIPAPEQRATGTFTFSMEMPLFDLKTLGFKWLGDKDSSFKDVDVFATLNGRHVMTFIYVHKGAGDVEKYFRDLTKSLKKTYEDKYVGCDIAMQSYHCKDCA